MVRFVKNNIGPDLVLITGDILHKPNKDGFEKAKRELSLLSHPDKCLICPGNHDRHWLGNALGPAAPIWNQIQRWKKVHAWFDNKLSSFVVGPDVPRTFKFGTDAGAWRIWVLGFDTSQEAKYSAQGFAKATELTKLREACDARPKQFHLSILLHHHHLLPIMALENEKQRAGDLISATIMLNAGTMLETLAQYHVNLVLHGHEHHHSIAKYGTMKGLQSEVVVVGAGSVTGNKTFHGCARDRASFNLIELHADRSIVLKEVRHEPVQGWLIKEESKTLLMGPDGFRRSRFLHRVRTARAETTSTIRKYVEFHRNRNVTITQTLTDRRLESGTYTGITYNSSGWPYYIHLEFHHKDGSLEPFDKILPTRDRNSDHKYYYKASSKHKPANLQKVECRVDWLAAGVLTTDDLQLLPRNARGLHRNRDREFAGIQALQMYGDLAAMSLLVKLPKGYEPKRDSIEVYFHTGEHNTNPVKSEELTRRLEFHSPELFSLHVPYPTPNHHYTIAWKPVKPPPLDGRAKLFRRSFDDPKTGQLLLESFAVVCGKKPILEDASFGLYVPAKEDTTLIRAAKVIQHDLPERDWPPDPLLLDGRSAYNRLAWWGQLQVGVPDPDDRADAPLLRQGERAFALVPIKPIDGSLQPYCLVRIGVRVAESVSDDALKNALRASVATLTDASIAMLYASRSTEKYSTCG